MSIALIEPFSAAMRWIESIPALLAIAFGVPMMLFGADWLVRGAVALARRMGISVLLIGLTVVAAGTSAPELAVNTVAAFSGNPDLSFGNVIGSNIANIGLVVGITVLIATMGVNSRIVRRELPWMIVVSVGAIVLALIPATSIEPVRAIVDWQFGYSRIDGAILLAGFLAFTVMWYRACRSQETDPLAEEFKDLAREESRHGLAAAIAWFTVGLALVLLGGKFTEAGAVNMAEHFGLSSAVIGMTVVAVATSLPELVTAIVACRKGYTDLAIGNVVGSNIFNLLLVMGVTAMIAEVPVPLGVGWQDLTAMLFLSVLLWWMCGTGPLHLARREGALLLILYGGYLSWGVLREVWLGAGT